MIEPEWWHNPGTWAHAYAKGPGQGDGSLCGRAVLNGRAVSCGEWGRCQHCIASLKKLHKVDVFKIGRTTVRTGDLVRVASREGKRDGFVGKVVCGRETILGELIEVDVIGGAKGKPAFTRTIRPQRIVGMRASTMERIREARATRDDAQREAFKPRTKRVAR